MARIRTIKPEFWDSPSVAKASPWARLLFIAMWNWADDYGRGTANLKELEGFAFPLDDEFTDRSGNAVQFRALVAEVADCFGVMFYEVDNRPYFSIPTWDAHQRNERRAKKSKHPDPPMIATKFEAVAETPCIGAEMPNSSGPGTGEQGNRGTGEQIRVSDSIESNSDGELLPADWLPNQKHYDHATSLGLDHQYQLARFREHAHRNQRRMKNWNTAFTNWLKKGAELAQQRQASGQQVAVRHVQEKLSPGQKARSVAEELRGEGL